MKPSPFSYHDPQSLSEAVGLLGRLEGAKVLAGGQSLVPMMNLRFLQPEHLVDINRIPELSGVNLTTEGRIRIGALTRHADLLADPLVRARMPVFAKALTHVAHFAIRQRGTFGGSICHLDPAAELPALVLLYNAQLEVIGPGGRRWIAAPDWFRGYMDPALAEGEILIAAEFDPWPKGHRYGFLELSRRHGDFAMAGAASVAECARDGKVVRSSVVVFGVQVSPMRLGEVEAMLQGQLLGEAIGKAAGAMAAEIDAMSDAYVDSDYRRRMAGILVRRLLEEMSRV